MHLCFEPHPCLAHITINAYRVNRAHHFHAPWSAAMSTMPVMITECPDRTGEWYAGWAAFTSHMERCLRIEKLLLNCDYITIVVHINESDGKTKLVMEGIQTPDFSPRMIENHPVNVNIVREDLAEIAAACGGEIVYNETGQPNRNALVVQMLFNNANKADARRAREQLASRAHIAFIQEWWDDL